MTNDFKNTETYKKIVSDRIPCFFISPHFDDIAFSAGGLICDLYNKTNVTVINVFTGAEGKDTISAKSYLKSCNVKDSSKLYETRTKEDLKAFNSLGVKTINLSHTDALWREKKSGKLSFIPEFKKIYPIYKLNIISGKIARDDGELITDITSEVELLLPKNKKYYVFAPIGLGNHVDHLIVRNSILNLGQPEKIVFYADMPYFLENAISLNSILINLGLETFVSNHDEEQKKKLCAYYQSQVNNVIADKTFYSEDELFFTKKGDNKSKLEVNIVEADNSDLLGSWKKLWENSDDKNFYNSPEWFTACLKTFNYDSSKIITVLKNGEIAGILPVVLSKKMGFVTWTNPGEHDSDKTPILVKNYDPEIINSLIERLKKLGNFYLTDMPERYILAINGKNGKIVKSSAGFDLEIKNNITTNLSKKTSNLIEKILNSSKRKFTSKIFVGNISQRIPAMKRIENGSLKANEFKQVLISKKYCEFLNNVDDTKNILINYLYYGNKPICYQYGFLTKSSIYWVQTAYLKRYRGYLPGKILTYLSLGQLKEMGISFVDFSRGDSDYKRTFTSHKYRQYSVFYSENFMALNLWLIGAKLFTLIESNPYLFEILRLAKNKTVKKFESIQQILSKSNLKSGVIFNSENIIKTK